MSGSLASYTSVAALRRALDTRDVSATELARASLAAAQARGDLEVLACIELAKHHVRAAHRRCQQALDHGVHVIQRRGEERPFAEERRRYAGERADDPDVAAMRERYALG